MLKAIKIRLYPNKEQEGKLSSLLGSYRFVYNQCLVFKKERYEKDKLNTNLSALGHYFHGELRNQYEWLKEQNTKVLKQSIINLERAYSNFFKQGYGFPRFKSKHDEQKARFPQEAVSSKTFNEQSSRLNLTKTINGLKFECSGRDKTYLYKNKEKIKSVTVTKKKCGHFYATILIDGDLMRSVPPTNKVVGIDLGIKSLMVMSDGTSIDNPKWIRSNERLLKKLQRQLSKKVKGSNNRKKAKLRLAKKHEQIKNQKQDFIHNVTSKLIDDNQVIVLEDLNVSGMLKNHKLAKSIQELGLYEMRRQLEYKSLWYGRELIFVDRFFPSSKMCSCCGWKNVDLKLSDREFICRSCGIVKDRDENAAINIESEGMRIREVGQRLPESTLVDLPLVDRELRRSSRSNARMKQEGVSYGQICPSSVGRSQEYVIMHSRRTL